MPAEKTLPCGGILRVDCRDRDLLDRFAWRLDGYVRASGSEGGKKKTFYLHRMVGERAFGPLAPGDEIDHKRHDKLDCRRRALRKVSHAENMANLPSREGSTSRHKGVAWDARRRKWTAQIQRAGRKRFLGRFKTQREALAAYSAAERGER